MHLVVSVFQKPFQNLLGLAHVVVVLGRRTKAVCSSFHPDTLVLVQFIPGFQSAGPGAVEHLVAAVTRGQPHQHGSTTVIAELRNWFPV